MPLIDRKIANGLLGTHSDFPLERRVLNAAILASALINTCILLQAVVSDYAPSSKAFAVLMTTITWSMYGVGRRRHGAKWLWWAFTSLICLIILLDWFFIGGYSGVTVPAMMILTGMMPAITSKGQLRFGFSMLTIVFGIIVVGDLLAYDQIPKYPLTLKRVMEGRLEVFVVSLGLGAISYLAVSSFRRQKEKADLLAREALELNTRLEEKNRQLEEALLEVNTLRGIIPICSSCKKIRNDNGYYEVLEQYIQRVTDADFSHTMCPECIKKYYPEYYDEVMQNFSEKANKDS